MALGDDWVSASRTRNYLQRDPLIDWLDRFGESHGFSRDDLEPGYDERTDFLKFVFAKGQQFETEVIDYLTELIGGAVRIAWSPADVANPAKADETLSAMRSGTRLILQGVLHDPSSRTYGAPDILLRSDVLGRLFPEALPYEEIHIAAPAVSEHWHYRAIDIKFTTLHLTAKSHAARGHSAYMAQVYVYNRALGSVQGYLPPAGFLLGRGWEQRGERGKSCMERLAPVEQHFASKDFVLADAVEEAVGWIRRMRRQGDSWSPLTTHDVTELRPNMSNTEDAPWHSAKRRIASQTGELTILWNVGPNLRDSALASGLSGLWDPRCSASSIGLTGDVRPAILDAIIDINRPGSTALIRPACVTAGRDVWSAAPPLEFFVDFETVTNLDDDFSRIPEQNGQTLITMIGVGHIEADRWHFAQFAVAELTEAAEANAIDDWLAHMEMIRARVWPNGNPVVYHWSHAETSTLDSAYNAARIRHSERRWPTPNWFDLLSEVVRAEPMVVKGAFGFGLKAVAKALHSHGLIQTTWSDTSVDGLGAMVGTWWAAAEAKRLGCDMNSIDLIREIGAYNEIDCRAMAEVLMLLRGPTTA